MSNRVELPRDWEWDGRKLKPRYGATSSNSWEFDGRKIKSLYGANFSNTCEISATQLKPVYRARNSNTWDRNNQPIAVLIGKVIGLY